MDNQSDMWAALGDATRRAIFERIVDEPRAVGELAAEFPVSRPAVSQHLKVLKDVGLVIDRVDGTRRIYQASPEGLEALRAQLDNFWSRALAAYKDVAEERPKQHPRKSDERKTADIRAQADRRRGTGRAGVPGVRKPVRSHQAARAQPARRRDR